MYSTSDMYLAALLLATKHNLDKADRTDSRHIRFFFSGDRDSIDKVVQMYLNRDAVVNVGEYVDALRKIKTLIYAE